MFRKIHSFIRHTSTEATSVQHTFQSKLSQVQSNTTENAFICCVHASSLTSYCKRKMLQKDFSFIKYCAHNLHKGNRTKNAWIARKYLRARFSSNLVQRLNWIWSELWTIYKRIKIVDMRQLKWVDMFIVASCIYA